MIDRPEKAYEMYLRTARLDLDDYNNDTEDGLHITSMGGTWLAFVIGLGGMRTSDGEIRFNPILPKGWGGYSFNVNFKGATLNVKVNSDKVEVSNLSDSSINLSVNGKSANLNGKSSIQFN